MFLTNTIVEENEELANWVNQMLQQSGNVSKWTSISKICLILVRKVIIVRRSQKKIRGLLKIQLGYLILVIFVSIQKYLLHP